jgi:general secretion pathway protein E
MEHEAPATVRARDDSRPLSYGFARRNGVLVSDAAGGSSPVVQFRPDVSPEILVEVRRYLGAPLRLEPVPQDVFDRRLQLAYEAGSDQTMQVMDDLDEDLDLARLADQLPEPEDLLESEDDAPIIRLINAILTEAVKRSASDVHVEAFETRVAVRMRIDGVLQEVLQPRSVVAPLLISRIKVMARLDIAEKRLPQDGRISLRVASRAVDVRVSTMPAGHGERVVMRLLDKQAGRLDLEQLGMAPAPLGLMDSLIQHAHGVLLVTGPTGSGKTTTLYAALGRLDKTSKNIMTVEDPIEYYIDGIGQTQVNAKVEMTFARGLRAILRQDPDVVMVGEIRDLDTAQIAVQASLTGHLVLSTLHTNSAVGAVNRLRDMGVEPYLLASSLIGVMSQRLVRVLCDQCRRPYVADEAACDELGLRPGDGSTLYAPSGCEKCNFLGYRGRTGIYELVEVDETLRNMIYEGRSEHEIEKQARGRSQSIWEDGVRKVLAGQTSVEEVLRVIRAD